MKLTKLLIILFALSITGCEFQSYEDYGIPPYDGSLTFTEITHKAAWTNRFDHAATVFNGKIWIFGGYNPGEIKGDTYYEDIWSSADGENWDLISEIAPWHGRRGHKVVTFNDGEGAAMYLIGGFEVNESNGYRQYCNDVWKSSNGEDWTLIKQRTYPDLDSADTWFPRMDHAVVVARHDDQEYIYIIGGRTQLEDHNGIYAHKYFNDIWRSTDGITWQKLPNNNFGRRAGHAAAVDPNSGTIYIQGGNHGVIFETENNASQPLEDWMYLWSSPDGINWTSSYDSIVPVDYTRRKEHEMIFYENRLWVFPGATTSTMHYHLANSYHYPIWTYDDGRWDIDSKGSDLRGRHSYATVVFNDQIFFLGGFTSNLGQNNDVWSAQ